MSLDERPEEVVAFREGEWTLPWINIHAGPDFESESVAQFEIFGIPKAILVDAEGMIVGTDEDARGEGLRETLSRLLTP